MRVSNLRLFLVCPFITTCDLHQYQAQVYPNHKYGICGAVGRYGSRLQLCISTFEWLNRQVARSVISGPLNAVHSNIQFLGPRILRKSTRLQFSNHFPTMFQSCYFGDFSSISVCSRLYQCLSISCNQTMIVRKLLS